MKMWWCLCTAKVEEKKTQQKVNFKNPSEVDLLLYKPQWFLEHWLMMSECVGLPRACTEMWPCGLGPYMGNFPSVTKVGNPGDTGPCLKLSLPPVLSVFSKNTFSAGWIQQWFYVQHFLFDPMNWAGLGELCHQRTPVLSLLVLHTGD